MAATACASPGETPVEEAHGLLTAAQLDDIQKAAHDEALSRGAKEGLSYGHRGGLGTGPAQMSAPDRAARPGARTALDKPL